MNKQDKQIFAWLEEEFAGEEDDAHFSPQIVSESDGESEHSDHNTDTEQSAAESDKDVPSTSRVSPVISPAPTQESLRRGRGRGRRRGRRGGSTVVQNIPTSRHTRSSTVTHGSRSPSPVSAPQRPSRHIQPQCTRTERSRGRSSITVTSQGPSRHRSRSPTRSRSRSSSNEPLAQLIDRRRISAAAPTEASSERRPTRIPMYKGKDGTKWLVHPPSRPNIRTRQENIVINPPGVKGEDAKNSQTPLECFYLFVTKQMLEDIVLFTNIHIREYKEKFSRERDTKETDLTEIEALVGLLLMAGMKKMHHLNIHEMWIDDGTAPDIFKATMSKTRFFFC